MERFNPSHDSSESSLLQVSPVWLVLPALLHRYLFKCKGAFPLLSKHRAGGSLPCRFYLLAPWGGGKKSAEGVWCSGLDLHHLDRQPIFVMTLWMPYPCILYQACDAQGIYCSRGQWCSELSLHQLVSRLTFYIPRRTAQPYFLYHISWHECIIMWYNPIR